MNVTVRAVVNLPDDLDEGAVQSALSIAGAAFADSDVLVLSLEAVQGAIPLVTTHLTEP